ncbi:MAG: amidohydrolase family protein [Eubacterium sp.]|nr:amidohydrolase family protein [Candidatus Colimonas fimequi]
MNYIIKGDFAYNRNKDQLITVKDGYLVCVDGISQGIFEEIPSQFQELQVIDYTNKLIIPGMIDLHTHAPQYAFRGMYMDEELMDWLNKYTFLEEAKYYDLEYAERAYSMFANELKKSATTRVVMFATVHVDATKVLMNQMEHTGLISYVGKVNMDRNAPSAILDESASASAYETECWINETKDKFKRTHPILTPRFIPCCSDELLEELGEIASAQDIPVQSHLSENPGEVELVARLMPDTKFYGEGYDRYNLFGRPRKTIMAHCVYSADEEVQLMRDNGVYVAHCPSSNMNLRSGIAPIRRYIDMGLNMGLGSDVAAGESESIFGEIKKAIEVSKLYKRYVDNDAKPLTFAEGFWLATLAGGSFFGQVGSFDSGYQVDMVVLADELEPHPQPLNIAERLERSVYLGLDRTSIVAKYVAGEKIYEK